MLNQTFEIEIRRLVWSRKEIILFSHVCICCLRWRCQQDWRCCWTCPLLTGAASFSFVSIGLIICCRETQVKHAWNSEDRSLNIFVKVSFSIFSMVMLDQNHSCHQKPHHLEQEDDKLTFHRHPVAQSTDCIRAKVSSNNSPSQIQIYKTLSKDFFCKYKISTSNFKKNINPRLVMNEAFTSLNCAGRHARSLPNCIEWQFDDNSIKQIIRKLIWKSNLFSEGPTLLLVSQPWTPLFTLLDIKYAHHHCYHSHCHSHHGHHGHHGHCHRHHDDTSSRWLVTTSTLGVGTWGETRSTMTGAAKCRPANQPDKTQLQKNNQSIVFVQLTNPGGCRENCDYAFCLLPAQKRSTSANLNSTPMEWAGALPIPQKRASSASHNPQTPTVSPQTFPDLVFFRSKN